MRVSSDWTPLAVAAVDANADTSGLALVDHTVNEVHVVGSRTGPVSGAFHINPQHTNTSTKSAVGRRGAFNSVSKSHIMRR